MLPFHDLKVCFFDAGLRLFFQNADKLAVLNLLELLQIASLLLSDA